MNQYAQVVLNMPHPSLDKPFDYAVPESMLCKISVGMRVIVPFGAKNKLTEGYVLSITDHTQVPRIRLKEISSLCEDDFMLLEQFIPIVEWMRQEYHCTYIDAIKCFVPPAAKKVKSPKYMDIISLTASQQQIADFIENNSRRAPVMCKVLMLLMDQPELAKEDIILNTWASTQTFISLKNRGFISIRKEEIYREADAEIQGTNKIVSLTPEQKHCIEVAQEQLSSPEKKPLLLRGVTGSGKTEVYMEAIDKCLKLDKTAIMLVPEIALTNQIMEHFIGRFGKDRLAVMHSKLTPRERYDEWHRIRSGRARIVIGARMGVFAPAENIGLIIMDEEHEATYKSDMTPKYDTVEVAAKRLQTTGGVLLLGSATPSVVSYERAKEGIYQMLTLKQRYNRNPLPRVEIVDMREELRAGNTNIFSRRLYTAIEETLKKGQQVILFQNRRGYSNFVSCRACGAVMKCPECDLSLVYHKKEHAMICHYCGRQFPLPETCPVCGSRYLKHFGIGTEQVEEAVATLFPKAALDRLDLDAVKQRKDLDAILRRFSQGKTDILIGTQLVAKGLDFHNVGLVGVIAADVSLNIPDYRSSERTFQLITQVAGRAGRGEERGLVVVQTYEPDNFVFRCATRHDYDSFFQEESALRSLMEYPPFGDIIMVNFTAEDEQLALDTALRCKAYMERVLGSGQARRVLSPKVSASFKGKDSFRHYLIIRCPRGKRNEYVYDLDHFGQILLEDKTACSMNIDVNPYSIF